MQLQVQWVHLFSIFTVGSSIRMLLERPPLEVYFAAGCVTGGDWGRWRLHRTMRSSHWASLSRASDDAMDQFFDARTSYTKKLNPINIST